jgi:outer membrane protein TolC
VNCSGKFVSVVLAGAVAPLLSGVGAAEPSAGHVLPQTPPEEAVVALDDLVLVALQRNLDLQSRRAQARIADSGVQSAESTFDPELRFDPSYTVGSAQAVLEDERRVSGSATRGDASATFTGTLPVSTQYSATLGSNWESQLDHPLYNNTLLLQLSQPLLRGRGRSIARARVEAAMVAADSSNEGFFRVVESTIAAVETAYWALGLAESVEGLARDSLRRAEELLERNRQLAELELIADADIVTAEAAVQARQTALVEATRVRQDAVDDLLFLVYGRDAASQLRNAGIAIHTEPPPDSAPDVPELSALEDRAVGVRHDLRAAQLNVEESEISVRVADNGVLPELDLVGSYRALSSVDGFDLFDVSRVGDSQFDGFSAAAVFTYSLRNNEAKARQRQAGLQLERDQLAVSAVENAVRSEVRRAARGVRFGRQKLEEARQSRRLEQRRYQDGIEQLRLGLIDTFRLLQIEEDVTASELIENRALYELVNWITRYELALGEIDDKYIAGGAGVSR